MARPAAGAGHADHFVNLTFHGIGRMDRHVDEGERTVWLTQDEFTAALDEVVGHAHVRISFDDGNASDRTIAVDALASRGLDATFFLAAGLLGTKGYLTDGQVREILAAGMRIGSHGMHHRPWPGLPAADLDVEIVGARRRLEEITGRSVAEAACPFGSYDRRVLRRLKDAEFERVYTSDRGTAPAGDWIQPRFTVRSGDGPDVVRGLIESRTGLASRVARGVWWGIKRWR